MSAQSPFARWWDSLWATATRYGVMRDLADTRWDRLRTPGGLRLLIFVAFSVMFAGPPVVWFVEDPLGLVTLAFVVSVFLTWFLLRRAVRLIPDAPDEALDERLMAIRDRAYLGAYRAFAGLVGLIAAVFLVWSIAEIRAGVISASLSMTWPQVNAVIWFVFAQILLWPSVVLAIALQRKDVSI